MDIRRITPDYAVSPQISPQDMEAIREAGFTTILNNRPDGEIGAESRGAAMAEAARAAGLDYVENPVTHQGLNPAMVARQLETVESAPGPVLAYCASGTRSTIVWALGQSGRRPVDETISLAREAGYDIAGLRPRLETGF